MNRKSNTKKRLTGVERLQRQIDYLGPTVTFDAYRFLIVRLLSTLLLGFALYYITDINYVVIPLIAIVYYYLIYYIMIVVPIQKRNQKLDSEALVFFEILTLALESGRSLENSLEITVENTDSELSDEFKRTLREVKYGKSFVDALKDMKKRIPSETINNVILSITEASIFGGSLVDNMYNQIDFLREKQILSVREIINKIPNKISIISVLCMVPLMLMLILGPLVIQYIR